LGALNEKMEGNGRENVALAQQTQVVGTNRAAPFSSKPWGKGELTPGGEQSRNAECGSKWERRLLATETTLYLRRCKKGDTKGSH